MKIYEIWMTCQNQPGHPMLCGKGTGKTWTHAHYHRPRSTQTPILMPHPDSPPRCLLPCHPAQSPTSMKASPWMPPMLPLQHKHKRHSPCSCWKAQQSGGARTALCLQGCVEIELAWLIIHLLLVLYLSFSSMIMLSSMHHIDTHIF